jgi:MoaA/NifB/PqqE/SkfB family radical SAM enzyme
VEVIYFAKEKGLRCSVLTNGTLIKDEMPMRIVNTRLDVLQFSLDGPKDVHNKIRCSEEAFDRTTLAARLIAEEKKKQGVASPALSFCCTISAANMGSLVPLVDIAKEVGASINYGYLFYTTKEMIDQTNSVIQMGSAKGEDQDVDDALKDVNANSLREEVDHVRSYARETGVDVRFQPDLKGSQILRRFHDDQFVYVNKCFYPWYALRINPYGEVYPCSINIEMGNLREMGLAEIWNGEKYIWFRKKLKGEKLFPKCVKCCKLDNKLWRYLPTF